MTSDVHAAAVSTDGSIELKYLFSPFFCRSQSWHRVCRCGAEESIAAAAATEWRRRNNIRQQQQQQQQQQIKGFSADDLLFRGSEGGQQQNQR